MSIVHSAGGLQSLWVRIHEDAEKIKEYSYRASAGNSYARKKLPAMVSNLARKVREFRFYHAQLTPTEFSSFLPPEKRIDMQNFTQRTYSSKNLHLHSYNRYMQFPFVSLLTAWREISWDEACSLWFSGTEEKSLDSYLFSLFSEEVGRHRDYVFIDIETTATEPTHGDIIEVAAIRTNPEFKIVDEFHTLCDMTNSRERDLVGTGSSVHGIRHSDISSYKHFSFYEDDLNEILDGDITVVAHGSSFEWRWLSLLLPWFWEKTTDSCGRIVNVVDTMLMTKFIMSGTPDNTLRSFVVGNDEVYENPHRAHNDASMMMRAFAVLSGRLQGSTARPEFLFTA